MWDWLYWPVKVFWNGIGDGRHRLTFLRLHRDPEHEVLVRIEHGRSGANPAPGSGWSFLYVPERR